VTATYTITRKIEFDAGHRVYQHESKCNHIHGHRYVVEVECTGSLDKLGRVVDFSVIKGVFGKWIDDNLDHGMLIFRDDPIAYEWRAGSMSGHRHFIMDKNPTAENIAELLYYKAKELLAMDGVKVNSVLVWETPNCYAVFTEK